MESFMLERRTWALSPAGGTKGQGCSKSQRDHQLRKKAATCLVVGQGQFSELETMGSEVTQLDWKTVRSPPLLQLHALTSFRTHSLVVFLPCQTGCSTYLVSSIGMDWVLIWYVFNPFPAKEFILYYMASGAREVCDHSEIRQKESGWVMVKGFGWRQRIWEGGVNFRDICIMTGLGDHGYKSERLEDNKGGFELLAGEVGWCRYCFGDGVLGGHHLACRSLDFVFCGVFLDYRVSPFDSYLYN